MVLECDEQLRRYFANGQGTGINRAMSNELDYSDVVEYAVPVEQDDDDEYTETVTGKEAAFMLDTDMSKI